MIAFAPFMSQKPKQDLSGTVIDSLEFARDGGRIFGSIPVAALLRLRDGLVDDAGALRYEVWGERDFQGASYLMINVDGELMLRCQRCLDGMAVPLHVAARLRLVAPGAPWPEDDLEDDSADAIEADSELALLPLIEDEVLLALPLVPRHGRCEPPRPLKDEQELAPFAVLAKLKKQ